MDSFLNRFHSEEVKSILLEYFKRCEGNKFHSEDSSDYIELVCNEDSTKIVKVIISENFDASKLKEIENLVYENLEKNVQTGYARTIIFSDFKVTGYFKCGDLFQILPVPDDAPSHSNVFAPHPFYLEYKFSKTSNSLVNLRRQNKSFLEICRFLKAFSRISITFSTQTKGLTWGRSTETQNIELFQESYYLKGAELFEGIGFSDTSNLSAIALVEENEYYLGQNFKYGDFTLPDSLASTFKHLYNLKGDKFDMILRACTWIETAQNIWYYSKSASFISYVNALETFLDQPETCRQPEGCGQLIASTIKDGEICEKCGQPRLRLNSRFKDFLKRHGVPDSMENEANLLYKTRSGLAHGAYLFDSDYKPYDFLSDKKFTQDMLHRRVHLVCILVLSKWLEENSSNVV